MKTSVLEVDRPARRRIARVVRKSKDAAQVRRIAAVLAVDRTGNVTAAARTVVAARSSVYRWLARYDSGGEEALVDNRRGRPVTTVTLEVLSALDEILTKSPGDFGYLRTRWTSELLALVVAQQAGTDIHVAAQWEQDRLRDFSSKPRLGVFMVGDRANSIPASRGASN